MRASMKDLKKQMDFILELTKRLDADIKHGEMSSIAFADYKPSRVREDVARIRRELNTLSKMTEWRWE